MSESYDVVIAGGAVMGSSTAYHLAANPDFKGKVLVLDKDLSFQHCASALSASSIRQQYSSAINIRVSQYGLWFLRHVGEILQVEDDRPDLGFKERGYLYIATDAGASVLRENHLVQSVEGADIALLEPDALQKQFPWLITDEVALGAWGRTGEGWFDGYGLMQGFRKKARALGVTYKQGEVADILRDGERVTGVKLSNGETLSCGTLINTCGASGARALCERAGVAIPVYSKKRCVFTFAAEKGAFGEAFTRFPLLIDLSGVWVRTEGEGFVTGFSPDDAEAPEDFGFDVDWSIFEETIWPALAARATAFESIRPGRAWAGHYDMNLFDHNAIVGALPGVANMLVAAGFSGHGLQQSPAVGRGLAELVTYGAYKSLDLSDFAYARIAEKRPLVEKNVI